MVREGLSEKVTFDELLECNDGAHKQFIHLKQNIPGRGNSQCKGSDRNMASKFKTKQGSPCDHYTVIETDQNWSQGQNGEKQVGPCVGA